MRSEPSTNTSLIAVCFAFLFSACQPNNLGPELKVNGNDIVNGHVASAKDAASGGLAESVVIVLTYFHTSADTSTDARISVCTGTLIDPSIVLTAAHCLPSGTIDDIIVGAGFLDLSKPNSEGIGLHVKSHAIHPGFNQDDQQGKSTSGSQFSLQSDLALLLLTQPAPQKVVPAKLPSADFNLAQFSGGLEIGYGIADDHYNTPVDARGTGVLRYLSFTKGSLSVRTVKDATTNMIAAETKLSSPCEGDSGGPLMGMKDGVSQNIIIGVFHGAGVAFAGQQQKDYEAAERAGNLDAFWRKYPSAPTCRGGMSVFVNVALELDWINRTKAELLSSLPK